YATEALAEAASLARKPAGLSWEEAAALPVATDTASRVLDELALAEGETLLLHGAGGGVGSVAVQLAVARGATVIGTASPANHDYLRVLGAVPVAYGDGLVERV
ncbi:NADP-dependent oxidoreductase, partial [Streptomyces sp. SID7499]|nr:NADP-dependent oxidoreductase [Streptomyces sp. SID7499]